MINMLNQVATRAKKWLILLIIIPLLTGAISYYLETKKATTYIATSSFNIGNFDNKLKGDISNAEGNIKSDSTLEKIKKSRNADFNVQDVKGRLVVTSLKDTLNFQYSGTDKEEVETTFTDITEGFIKVSNQKFYEKEKNLQKRIQATEQLMVESNKKEDTLLEKVLLEENIRNLEASKENLDKVTIANDIKVTVSYNNPLKRGIFGLILGLMLDIVILITPELFREYR